MKECADCHGAATSIHVGHVGREPRADARPSRLPGVPHPDVRAQGVHHRSTGAGASAGLDAAPGILRRRPDRRRCDGVTQRSTYSKQKGCFTWGTNVRPTLRYYDGKWNRVIARRQRQVDASQPVDLASPTPTYQDAGAMIYPFKKMTGNQVADSHQQDGAGPAPVRQRDDRSECVLGQVRLESPR